VDTASGSLFRSLVSSAYQMAVTVALILGTLHYLNERDTTRQSATRRDKKAVS